jgi:hypothetical protein
MCIEAFNRMKNILTFYAQLRPIKIIIEIEVIINKKRSTLACAPSHAIPWNLLMYFFVFPLRTKHFREIDVCEIAVLWF